MKNANIFILQKFPFYDKIFTILFYEVYMDINISAFMDAINNGFSELKEEITKVNKNQIRFENEIIQKTDAMDDRLRSVEENMERIDERQIRFENEITLKTDAMDERFRSVEENIGRMDERQIRFENEITQKVDSNTADIIEIKSEMRIIRKSQLYFENNIIPKIEVALDGYKLAYDKLLEHDKRLDGFDDKANRHELEIMHLRKINRIK